MAKKKENSFLNFCSFHSFIHIRQDSPEKQEQQDVYLISLSIYVYTHTHKTNLMGHLLLKILRASPAVKMREREDPPGGTMGRNPPTNEGDGVRSLAREDSTGCEATKLCATTAEPVLWSLHAAATEAMCLEPVPGREAPALQ